MLNLTNGIVKEALRTVWRFRLRSMLILLVSILGIAGVITSVDYGSSGRQRVFDQIRSLGTNVITVTSMQSRVVGGRARTGSIVTTLVDRDYTMIRRNVDHITRSSGLAAGSFKLKEGDFSKDCTVVGCEPDYMRIRSWPLKEGSLFDSSGERGMFRVAILGQTVASDLFGGASAIGQRLFINRVPFEVIGVLTERGQGLDSANEDNQVYIPLSTAMHRLMNVDYFSGLVFELDRWDEMDDAAAGISAVLRDQHKAKALSADDFQVQNQKDLIDTQIASAERLGFFVRWVGISGLVVSGIGTLSIYWIAIKERTVEVGTRRALGATASNIFLQILLEAALVRSAGSAIGIAVGWQGSKTVAQLADLPFVFDRKNAALALILSLVVNYAFSILPSARASSLDPIHALKYE